MADIRKSRAVSSSETEVFDAESVAGDLWMRQNYQDIHLELNGQEANAFIQKAEGAGLILEAAKDATAQADPDVAH